MRKIILLLLAFSASGCVNPYAYREEQEVTASFITHKSAGETQQCILSAWQKQPLLSSITQQHSDGYYSVLANTDNADVYSVDGKTAVKFYSLRGSLDVMSGKEKRINGIKSCL